MQPCDEWQGSSGAHVAEVVAVAVLDAVERDLAVFAKRSKGIDASTLAETARALAAELDDPSNSATSKSMCARALLDVLDQLKALLPPEKEGDALDDLSSRRAARIAGRAAPKPKRRS